MLNKVQDIISCMIHLDLYDYWYIVHLNIPSQSVNISPVFTYVNWNISRLTTGIYYTCNYLCRYTPESTSDEPKFTCLYLC